MGMILVYKWNSIYIVYGIIIDMYLCLTCTRFQNCAKLANGWDATEQSAPMMRISVSLLLVTCCTNPCTASVPVHCIAQWEVLDIASWSELDANSDCYSHTMSQCHRIFIAIYIVTTSKPILMRIYVYSIINQQQMIAGQLKDFWVAWYQVWICPKSDRLE